MYNENPLFLSRGVNNEEIKTIDINLNIETPDIIIGTVMISCKKNPETTVVGKIFIYKHTSPYFIETNFDETYLKYLFDDCQKASYDISNYVLTMLTIDFPSSVLSMSSSHDIGMVQLPNTINNSKGI
ncbi:hypothetical protein OXPF_00670 [Oxobacter pfennigii]|uniref:Uncharacterized protein n=1 Tax=Oxobacter pfennigii TaxID=36849 RepID=A0A0P8WE03_9CLOT|nr:hypothetical protein [Oxobacter pfennigii]KPU46339.1 hypothetical protein OXPF_00670 [Oxobacter pfennigii]